MSQPSTTNCPKLCMLRAYSKKVIGWKLTEQDIKQTSYKLTSRQVVSFLDYEIYSVKYVNLIYGGYSAGVPPLPIPNREVKPVHADGTA